MVSILIHFSPSVPWVFFSQTMAPVYSGSTTAVRKIFPSRLAAAIRAVYVTFSSSAGSSAGSSTGSSAGTSTGSVSWTVSTTGARSVGVATPSSARIVTGSRLTIIASAQVMAIHCFQDFFIGVPPMLVNLSLSAKPSSVYSVALLPYHIVSNICPTVYVQIWSFWTFFENSFEFPEKKSISRICNFIIWTNSCMVGYIHIFVRVFWVIKLIAFFMFLTFHVTFIGCALFERGSDNKFLLTF